MMVNHIEWTEQLGDAFLANQGAVMDAVQRLRYRAYAAGRFGSMSELSVTFDGGIVSIAAASADSVYVPWYNPASVFAPWPNAEYMPYYFPAPYGYVTVTSGFFGFGVSVAVTQELWGLETCDWRAHGLRLHGRHWTALGGGEPPADHAWHHDPAHRWAVPYASPEVRARYAVAAPPETRETRGYRNMQQPVPISPVQETRANGYYTPGVGSTVHGTVYDNRPPRAAAWSMPGTDRPSEPPPAETRSVTQASAVPSFTPSAQYQRPQEAPIFESLDRGREAREDSARGQREFHPEMQRPAQPVQARPEAPRPEPQHAEAPRSAPAHDDSSDHHGK
jgi:hypothetical protein